MAQAPVGAAGDLSTIKAEYVLQQIRHMALPQLSELKCKGYASKLTFIEFYVRYRPLQSDFVKGLLTVEGFLSQSSRSSWRRADYIMHCESLYKKCESAIKSSKEYGGKCWQSTDIVFGNNCVFMREVLLNILESYRASYLQVIVSAAVHIQSKFRTFRSLKSFKYLRKKSIELQSFIRCALALHNYKKKKQVTVLFQSVIRMFFARKTFLCIKKAAAVIKNHIFGKMFARIRHKRLCRTNRLFQNMVKGFILRRFVLDVYTAVNRIQLAAKRYLRKKHFFILQFASVIKLQQVIRGWLSRQRFEFITRILKLRSNQRKAQKVVRKLQAIWRRFCYSFFLGVLYEILFSFQKACQEAERRSYRSFGSCSTVLED